MPSGENAKRFRRVASKISANLTSFSGDTARTHHEKLSSGWSDAWRARSFQVFGIRALDLVNPEGEEET